MTVITLLSDFGLKDPYVAEMKAVILSICPEACIVDISHEIEKFDVRMGAFILASAAPYFPRGTVHVAVVDPGVGTERRPLLVETEWSFYVGPDNGLLMLSARRERIRHVYNINNPQYMRPQVSRTFHGRDIFAPAAAHLAKGLSPSEFGTEIHDYLLPKFAQPKLKRGEFLGEVLHIDGFGNIVTNISERDLEKIGAREGCLLHVKFKDKVLGLKLSSAYGMVPAGRALAIIGSGDLLEISVNQANASQIFEVKKGDSVNISY
ncbi:MAG: S-adenosyl-l-methionine hydroxide adenosyltransferase family protein [Candidatus Bathyarchaeia archaeon]